MTRRGGKSHRLESEIEQFLGAPRSPRSSARAIRNRQAAIRDYGQLAAERPSGEAGDLVARRFLEGFGFVHREILGGRLPEQAFDLSTSVPGVTIAFLDGAAAAKNLHSSRRSTMGERGREVDKPRSISNAEKAQAEKYARAYRIRLPAI